MHERIIKIPQVKQEEIWKPQLKVAAYCRVSTPYEEQKQSMESQIKFEYIQKNLGWRFAAVCADDSFGLRTRKDQGINRC